MTITRLFETGAYRVSMSNGAYEDIGYALNGDIVALIVEYHLFKSDGSGELCWERLHRKPWKSALSELLREIKHGRLRIVTTKEACAHENMQAKPAEKMSAEVNEVRQVLVGIQNDCHTHSIQWGQIRALLVMLENVVGFVRKEDTE